MKPTGCGADCIDALQPVASLWDRLALRIAAEEGTAPLPAADKYEDPPWNEVAPGISCKLLASDFRNDRVSMLVRLLDGELWINERKLVAGDYHRAEAGTADRRVWSETGCTCVLITSTRDRLTL